MEFQTKHGMNHSGVQALKLARCCFVLLPMLMRKSAQIFMGLKTGLTDIDCTGWNEKDTSRGSSIRPDSGRAGIASDGLKSWPALLRPMTRKQLWQGWKIPTNRCMCFTPCLVER